MKEANVGMSVLNFQPQANPATADAPQENREPALRDYVARVTRLYLRDMGSHDPCQLLRTVMDEVEAPLLQEVLSHTGHNQTRAAQILGISRSTLRKKLKHYALD